MSASLGLFRLQQVDHQIDRSTHKLEEVRKALAGDPELIQAVSAFEQAQAEHQRLARHLDGATVETKAQGIKIEQAEASLYGGKVHNPKELQDLQKDIVSLKKHLSTLEEREIEAMLQAEIAEAAFEGARNQLEITQARSGNHQKNLLEEQTKLIAELERLNTEREAASAPIEPSLIELYESLRSQKRGIAVTEVSDGACASCGTTLNASMQQNARSTKQIANCPSCGRILFAH